MTAVSKRTAITLGCAFGAVLSFIVQQRLIDVGTFMQHPAGVHGISGRLLGPDFYLALPFPVIDAALQPPASIHLLVILLAAAQTLIMLGLYRGLRGRTASGAERVVLVLAAVTMLLVALHARTLTSMDLYAYLGYALMPDLHAAYAPPATRFAGGFGVINDLWGQPMVASYYGPLWVAVSRLVAGRAETVGDGISALRVFEVAPFAAIVLTLALRRSGPAILALFALNPAVHMLFVANGHNDLFGIALVLVALAVAGTLPALAAVLLGLAGLVKLPFVAFAMLVFAGRGRLARRAGWVALALAVCVAGSLYFAGFAYAHDLMFRFHEVNDNASMINKVSGKILRSALMLIAAFGLLAAFVRGIIWRSVSWSFMTMSTVVWSWYLAWCFPYASLEGRALARYLILLPAAAVGLDNAFPHLGLGQLTMLLMLAAAGYEIARRKWIAIPVPGAVSPPYEER